MNGAVTRKHVSAVIAAIALLSVSVLFGGCKKETDNAVTVTHPKATMTGGGDMIEEDYGDEDLSDDTVSESLSEEAVTDSEA